MKSLKYEPRQQIPAARVVSCLLLVVVMVCITTPSAQSSGLYTHTWFVESAIQKLAAQGGRYQELVRILNKHSSLVNYGAIFPDLTYSIDENWAEIAHGNTADGLTKVVENNYFKYLKFLADKGYDKYNGALQTAYYKQFLGDPAYAAEIPPFRAALIAEMANHFQNNPRSESDEQMLAFLFGVIAHQEADTPWHLDRPDCKNPAYKGIGWGLECAAVKTRGYDNSIGEIQLDNLLYHYDQGHTVAFDFAGTAKNVVYAAIDHAGIRRPTEYCPFHSDALDCGNFNLTALWTLVTKDWGGNDANRDWLWTYVPGGIDNGSAFVAGAWMDTWDRFAPAAPELPIGRFRSLQSYNYPDRYIRHSQFQFRIDPIATELDQREATFKLVPGLADTFCVSFESLSYPNYYLQGSGRFVNLSPFQDNPEFRARATFCPRPGLTGTGTVSFESYPVPGSYLRHSDYWLWVSPWDGTQLFRSDATFSVVAPMQPPSVYLPLLSR